MTNLTRYKIDDNVIDWNNILSGDEVSDNLCLIEYPASDVEKQMKMSTFQKQQNLQQLY
jgi:hypothetical protein